MTSDLDLLLACAATALVTNAAWIAPRWLDTRRTRRQQQCALPSPHNGPCQPTKLRGNR